MIIPDDLVSFLRRVERAAVLTGAGVSQESGLRTFRDAQTGLWAKYKPEDLASPEAFARDPGPVWNWYAMRREKLRTVEPNPAHYALAEMARSFLLFTLITQNVDGLHQKAEEQQAISSPLVREYSIIELHGNIGRVKCSRCGKLGDVVFQPEKERDPEDQESGTADTEIPQCALCGGLLRPDVVWFGESLPKEALESAALAARNCDVFFSIGTSGLVQPAASLAFAAHNRGAVVIEVNPEPTPLTEKADFSLCGKAGEILPALITAVWK